MYQADGFEISFRNKPSTLIHFTHIYIPCIPNSEQRPDHRRTTPEWNGLLRPVLLTGAVPVIVTGDFGWPMEIIFVFVNEKIDP